MKCSICGYSKCDRALTFHHLNPKQKDFSLGSLRANPKSWNIVVTELRKCVLLCHICHTELHEGIIDLPQNVAEFNEKYAVYKKAVNNGFSLPKPINQ